MLLRSPSVVRRRSLSYSSDTLHVHSDGHHSFISVYISPTFHTSRQRMPRTTFSLTAESPSSDGLRQILFSAGTTRIGTVIYSRLPTFEYDNLTSHLLLTTSVFHTNHARYSRRSHSKHTSLRPSTRDLLKPDCLDSTVTSKRR